MIGKSSYNLVGLDSNIFIYHFEENPAFINHVQNIFTELTADKFKAITSIVSVIETLSYPSPPKVLASIKESFYIMPNLTIVDVNQDIAIISARIRREYGLRIPDAIQLATALSYKAEVFVTNDKRLKVFKEIKILFLSKDTNL